jgi:hypothetical protein
MGVSRNDFEKTKLSIATGAGSATKVTVTGMTVADTVIDIIDLTNNAQIATTGLTMVSGGFKVTASTTGLTLLVHWVDASLG